MDEKETMVIDCEKLCCCFTTMEMIRQEVQKGKKTVIFKNITPDWFDAIVVPANIGVSLGSAGYNLVKKGMKREPVCPPL